MPESTQHKLDRIRPPRVQITYDVETRGSFVKKELPFVVGIMADLSKKRASTDPAAKPLSERKYVEIDRDNFGEIMKNIAPAVSSGSTTYTFESLEDFTPIRLLKPANETTNTRPAGDDSDLGKARAAYDQRVALSDMVAKLDGNTKLQNKLIEILADTTKRQQLTTAVTALDGKINPPASTPDPTANPAKPKKPETPGGK